MFGLQKIITLAVLASVSVNAHAALDMFLQLDGIAGETKDPTYAKGIDVLAWSWNMANAGNAHVQPPDTGKANFADISFTKYIDRSSTQLYRLLANGGFIPSGTLTIRKPAGKKFVFEQIAMKDILVTSASTGGSGGEDRLTENISLNFASFCIRYTEQLDDGGAGAKPELCWNIATNQSCTAQQIDDLFSLPMLASLPPNLLQQLTPVCSDS